MSRKQAPYSDIRRKAQASLARIPVGWVLVALVALSAGLRLWHLNVLPPGLFFDEAYNGLDASRVVSGVARPLFFMGNNGREPLYIYLQALAVAFLGATPIALRLTSAVIGIATVPIVYFAARIILLPVSGQDGRSARDSQLTPWFALIATAGVAISYWHLSLSRLGFRAVLLVPVSALAIAFFWRAWAGMRWRDYAWSGVWFGVALYTYTSARALPLVVILFVLWELAASLIGHRSHRRQNTQRWQKHFKGLALIALVASLTALPLIVEFGKNPSLLWTRIEDVNVLSATAPELVGTPPDRLLHNIIAVARNFYDQGDQNLRHNLPGRPVFDPLLAALFSLGWLSAVLQIRQPRNRLLLIWLLMMLLPTVLSTDAPHSLRSTGALPAAAILCAMGGQVVYKIWKAWKQREEQRSPAMHDEDVHRESSMAPDLSPLVPLVTVLLVLIISGGLTYRDYFHRWAILPELGTAFEVDLQLAAQETAAILQGPSASQATLLSAYLYSQPQLRFALGQPVMQDAPPESYLDPSGHHVNTQFIFEDSFDPNRPLVLLWREGDQIEGAWPGPLVMPMHETPQQEEDSFLFPRAIVWPTDELGWPSVFTGQLPRTAYFCQSTAPYPLAVEFANGTRLVGYDVDVDLPTLSNGMGPVRLTLYWQQKLDPHSGYSFPEEQTRQDDFGISIHLVHEQDLWQAQDGAASPDWIINREYVGGQVHKDVHVFSMPMTEPSSKAYFSVGLFELGSGQSSDQVSSMIPIVDRSGRTMGDRVAIAVASVPTASSGPVQILGAAPYELQQDSLIDNRSCLDMETQWPFAKQAWEDNLVALTQETGQVPDPIQRADQVPVPSQPSLADEEQPQPFISGELHPAAARLANGLGEFYPAAARFANGMRLIAYDLEPDILESSEGDRHLRLRLFWQGDLIGPATPTSREDINWWTDREFDVFAHLVAGNAVWQTANRRFLDTDVLVQGRYVEDIHEFSVPRDIPAGKAYFEVGLYYRSDADDNSFDANPRIPLVNLNQQIIGDMVTLGGVMISPAPQVEPIPSPPALVVGVDFQDHIQLSSLRLERDPDAPLQIDVVLDWQAQDRPEGDYTAFVHLIDQEQNIVAQYDQPPGGADNPSHLWAPNETIRSIFPLQLPAGVALHDLALRIGLYSTTTAEQLPITSVASSEASVPYGTYAVIPAQALP